jgi:hypothetical protein
MSIFDYFRKKEPERVIKQVELSKIDKHVNLILREKLASNNRVITDTLDNFDETKKEIVHQLRELHKKSLMNPNIPRREIQIMEGNRDNYIKRVAHFITGIEAPRQYLELYYYTIKFSEEMDILSKDTQKNKFVLKEFFENELKSINKEMNLLEESMISIRVLFEKHNIQRLQEVVNDIDKIKQNLTKTIKLREEIKEHEATVKDYEDKINKLEERVHTITTGTDFRALENFKTDKESVEEDIKNIFKEFDTLLSGIDTALKKYYYKNQDKKIIREYLEEPYKTLLKDRDLEIERIIKDITENLDSIDLKDKKKEHVLENLSRLTFEYLKKTQSELLKLEDQKQHMQTKITHNSASLNLSEQQYWMKANHEKIRTQNDAIMKLQNDLERFDKENKMLRQSIHEEMEKIIGENIELKDDLTENS